MTGNSRRVLIYSGNHVPKSLLGDMVGERLTAPHRDQLNRTGSQAAKLGPHRRHPRDLDHQFYPNCALGRLSDQEVEQVRRWVHLLA